MHTRSPQTGVGGKDMRTRAGPRVGADKDKEVGAPCQFLVRLCRRVLTRQTPPEQACARAQLADSQRRGSEFMATGQRDTFDSTMTHGCRDYSQVERGVCGVHSEACGMRTGKQCRRE